MKLPSRPNDFRDSGDSKSSYRSCGDSQVHIHIRAEEQIDLEKVEFATKGQDNEYTLLYQGLLLALANSYRTD
jgi:hypothetical protein